MTATQIRISSGRLVDLNDFKVGDICQISINRALNNIKRFTGHFKFASPLTVAQHTKLVVDIAELKHAKGSTDTEWKWKAIKEACRIHDYPEAYYGDLSSPLKKHFGDFYRDKIVSIDNTIFDHYLKKVVVSKWELEEDYRQRRVFSGSFPMEELHDYVKEADTISLRIEQSMMWGTVPPEPEIIEFFETFDTRQMFLEAQKNDFIELEKL